jgi:hypothetical protein
VSAADDRSKLRNLGTVMGTPDTGLRYMRRRRVGTADRSGDPLDGVVNLFDVAIILAVGFLVAALSAAGITGLLTSENMTIVTDPGTPQMQVIVKDGDTITKLDMDAGETAEGVGTLLGSFYRLADGTVVYVPSGDAAPPGATPVPDATPAPDVSAYPSPEPYPTTTPNPTVTPVPTVAPTPGVTLTPDTSTEVEPRGTL